MSARIDGSSTELRRQPHSQTEFETPWNLAWNLAVRETREEFLALLRCDSLAMRKPWRDSALGFLVQEIIHRPMALIVVGLIAGVLIGLLVLN